jgi:predicted PurR-regulated permease PerM
VRNDDPRALIRYALVGAVLTIALVWTAWQVRSALLLIYVATLVAIGLSPLVESIERRRAPLSGKRRHFRRLPRWAAILVIYLALIGALIGVGMLTIPPLVEQGRELAAALPSMSERTQQWLIDRKILSEPITMRTAVEQSPIPGTDAVGTVLGAVWGVVGGLFGFVTILILAFYFLVDSRNIVRTFLRLFPYNDRPRVEDACLRVVTKVSAWLGGQLLLGLIIGTTAAIGLGLMGVPYSMVLALIAGIGEMIPIVGPLLAAIPAVAVAFSVSPTLALGVAVFFIVQQQFENHVLVPKVMERQVGVSAVVVIVSLLIGGTLLGIMGAILAVPTAAILQVLFEELARPDETAAS